MILINICFTDASNLWYRINLSSYRQTGVPWIILFTVTKPSNTNHTSTNSKIKLGQTSNYNLKKKKKLNMWFTIENIILTFIWILTYQILLCNRITQKKMLKFCIIEHFLLNHSYISGMYILAWHRRRWIWYIAHSNDYLREPSRHCLFYIFRRWSPEPYSFKLSLCGLPCLNPPTQATMSIFTADWSPSVIALWK